MAKHVHTMKARSLTVDVEAKRQSINCHHDSDGPCAEPDPLHLSKSAGDQAEWSSTQGRAFTIHFGSRSPFAGATFHVPRGGSVSSGPITGQPGSSYKYSLENDQGKVKDPTIIIDQ